MPGNVLYSGSNRTEEWLSTSQYSKWVCDQSLKEGGKYKEFHGRGVYTDTSGNRYEGEWVKGQKNGEGTMKYANGDIYEGTWKDDVRNGKGIMTYINLDRYDGDWDEGQRAGEGVIIYANGDRYNGTWEKDEWHGYGNLTGADYSQYKGGWEEGELLKGKVIYANGRTYDGELEGLTEHGKGVMKYENGSCHNGQWWNGKKHGPGTFILKDKSNIKGNWENDEIRAGIREYYSGEVYTGGLSGLLPHGKGKMVYVGGIIYDGSWIKGKKIKPCWVKEKTCDTPRGISPRTVWGGSLTVSTAPGWMLATSAVLKGQSKDRRTPTFWEGVKIFNKKGENVGGDVIVRPGNRTGPGSPRRSFVPVDSTRDSDEESEFFKD